MVRWRPVAVVLAWTAVMLAFARPRRRLEWFGLAAVVFTRLVNAGALFPMRFGS